jgi:hypothetical protein
MPFVKKIEFEKDMYQHAAGLGKSFSQFAEDYIVEKGNDPTEYHGLSNYEVAMKKRQYRAEGKVAPLTAFEMMLEQEGIRAFGQSTDTVEKFFQSSGVSVLFPEFIANRVYAGALQASIVPQLTAVTTVISGLDFRKLYLEDTEPDRQTAKGNRAGEFPETQIKVGKQNVALDKYGRTLVWDYEAVYNMPINVYGTMLQRVGAQIGIDESDDLIYTLINGDGNSNGLESAQTATTATTATIVKKDIISFAAALPAPYQLTKFVGKKAYMIEFWNTLSNMTNPAAQWGEVGIPLPMGIVWDRSVVTADRFFGVDTNYAIGYFTNDAVLMTEADRIITKQQVRTVVSKRSAFDIIDQDAIGCLDIEH